MSKYPDINTPEGQKWWFTPGPFPGEAEALFETKDSGEREQYPSGMQRDTQDGKVRYDLAFDGPMFQRYAELMTRGATKYEARNWMKAATTEEQERFRQSAARHFMQWFMGDRSEDHAAAVIFNLNGYEYVRDRMMQVGQPISFIYNGMVFCQADQQPGDGRTYFVAVDARGKMRRD